MNPLRQSNSRVSIYGLLAVATMSFVLVLVPLLMPLLSAQPTPDTGINLQASPLPITLSTPPGQPLTTDLRIRNAGTQPEILKVTLRKFKASPTDGTVTLEDREPTDTYFDWVKFSRNTFEAPANEWQTIKMTISPPKDAAFGYYYAVQFSRATPATAQPGQRAIEGAVASFILLDVVNPNAKRIAEVVEFSADKRIYEFLPATLTVKLKNSGNTHIAPRGNIFITRGNSKLDPPLDVNSSVGYVLPGSLRSFQTEWASGFPVYVPKTEDGQAVLDKNQRPVRTLKWDFSQVPKLRIGKYTAKLLLVYDNGQRDVPIEATVSFWVVPWRILGVLLIVLVFVGIGFWSTGRKFWRRIRKQKPTE